jgi:putative redox protein
MNSTFVWVEETLVAVKSLTSFYAITYYILGLSLGKAFFLFFLLGCNMESTVRWMGQDGMSFSAEVGSGHLINMDGAPEAGGRNLAPRPMELLLAGAGGCTAFDVVMILKKARQEIKGCEVKLKATRADSDPKVFTHIHMEFLVTGVSLDPGRVAKAVELSHDKYCSATIMLGKTAEITHSIQIIEG